MRPLFIGLSLIFFQQITGQPSVLYYAGKMFEQAGLKMGQQSAGIAGLLGAFKLLMTCEHFPAILQACIPRSQGILEHLVGKDAPNQLYISSRCHSCEF